MDRTEHLQWAKQRALEYVDRGELANALASMLSDIEKHPDIRVNPFVAQFGMFQISRGHEAMRRWINGFN